VCQVVALAGKSALEIKAMSADELSAHVARCVRDTRISESSVRELASRAGCPDTEDTKEKRLAWLFAQL